MDASKISDCMDANDMFVDDSGEEQIEEPIRPKIPPPAKALAETPENLAKPTKPLEQSAFENLREIAASIEAESSGKKRATGARTFWASDQLDKLQPFSHFLSDPWRLAWSYYCVFALYVSMGGFFYLRRRTETVVDPRSVPAKTTRTCRTFQS